MNQKIFTVEIRYVPDPSFLDRRGLLVKGLIDKDFEDWKIDNNNLELVNPNGNIFVSYTNLGFITKSEDSLDIFSNKLNDVLKIAGNLPPIRWGVRTQQYIETTKSFQVLLDTYKNKFLNFQDSHFASIDGSLEDVALDYIFNKTDRSVHVRSGPMKSSQASQFFGKKEEEIPENGIYLDIDVYREKQKFSTNDYTPRKIMNFVRETLSQAKNVATELTGVIDD